MSDYRDAQATVLQAMGYKHWMQHWGTGEPLWRLPGLSADGGATTVRASTIDANWCFGVLADELKRRGIGMAVAIPCEGEDRFVAFTYKGSEHSKRQYGSTVEEAMIRAAASALDDTE